jgi:hypothetical protein
MLVIVFIVALWTTFSESGMLFHSDEATRQELVLPKSGWPQQKSEIDNTSAVKADLRNRKSDAIHRQPGEYSFLPRASLGDFTSPDPSTVAISSFAIPKVPCTVLTFSVRDPVGHPFQRGLAHYTTGNGGKAAAVAGPIFCTDCPSMLDGDSRLIGPASTATHTYNVTALCNLSELSARVRTSTFITNTAVSLSQLSLAYVDVAQDSPGSERARDVPAKLFDPTYGKAAVGKRGEFRTCRWTTREYKMGTRKILWGVFSARTLRPRGSPAACRIGSNDRADNMGNVKDRGHDGAGERTPDAEQSKAPQILCPVPYGFWFSVDLPLPDLARCEYQIAYCKGNKWARKPSKNFRKRRSFSPHRNSPLATGPRGEFVIMYGGAPEAVAARTLLLRQSATVSSVSSIPRTTILGAPTPPPLPAIGSRTKDALVRIHLVGDSIVYCTFEALVVLFGLSDQVNYNQMGSRYYKQLIEVKGNGVHLSFMFFIHACVERFDDPRAATVDLGLSPSESYDAVVVNYGLWDVQDGPATLCRQPLVKLWKILEDAVSNPEAKLILQLPAPRRHKGLLTVPPTGPQKSKTYRDPWSLHVAARAGIHALLQAGSSRAHALDMFSLLGPVMDATYDGRHFFIEANLDVANVVLNIIAGNSRSPAAWIHQLYPVQ